MLIHLSLNDSIEGIKSFDLSQTRNRKVSVVYIHGPRGNRGWGRGEIAWYQRVLGTY